MSILREILEEMKVNELQGVSKNNIKLKVNGYTYNAIYDSKNGERYRIQIPFYLSKTTNKEIIKELEEDLFDFFKKVKKSDFDNLRGGFELFLSQKYGIDSKSFISGSKYL